MAHAIRFHKAGGPEVLELEEVAVGKPGPGQARIRHVAVGLNFADTYFRSGFYKVPLPAGMGVEAAGVVEAIGEGVTNVAPGDKVTYTGFINTLGAYSTERLIPAAPLIKLPEGISCETAAASTRARWCATGSRSAAAWTSPRSTAWPTSCAPSLTARC